jgi:two-component system response regulator VicR
MTKILFVDDDRDLLISMKALFKQNGFDIAVTLSCDEGLGILKAFHPDLIFLDMYIGDQDGREMCKQIKEQADYRHIPIVFISGDREALKLYRDYGANSFVEKPLQFATLLEIVKDRGNLN